MKEGKKEGRLLRFGCMNEWSKEERKNIKIRMY